MAGRPLPVADLPAGTVSVRVARKMPANPATGIAVKATVTPNGGAPQVKTETTGEDGRATFAGLPPGAMFQAVAEVDGEALETQPFAVPATGGVRTMLISGLPPAGSSPAGAAPAGDPHAGGTPPAARFSFSITVPAPEASSDLPPGTLEVGVVDDEGRPVAGNSVNLGQAGKDGRVQAFEQTTDARGIARFADLPTAPDLGYLVVVEVGGFRVGSRPFRMPPDAGMRLPRLAPPARTDDLSVLSLDRSSRFIFEVREDFLFVGEVLSFKNDSDKVFDGGPGGIFVPLPTEMTSFQAFNDSAPVEEVKSKGLLMRAPVPPTGPRDKGVQARFAFMLPTYGDDTLVFEQKMPVGAKSPLVIVPDSYKLTLSSPGLKTLPKDTDNQGNAVSLYELADVKAGETIEITIAGLPKVDRAGHMVVIALCLVLLAWGLWGVLGVKRVDAGKLDRRRQDLRNRRENLFGELVALERKRRSGADVDEARRATLVTQLESVYRDLQALDQPKA